MGEGEQHSTWPCRHRSGTNHATMANSAFVKFARDLSWY
jgi:hypothetical protein